MSNTTFGVGEDTLVPRPRAWQRPPPRWPDE